MNDMRSEEEQIEALRQWWKENGTGVVTAVLLAIAGGFGWQAWQANQAASVESASNGYQAMMRAVDSGDESQRSQVVELAESLKADYSSTAYAQFAAMHLAALAVEGGDLDEAEAQLRWVLGKADKGSDNAIVAQLRLARVVASKGDAEQAFSLLSSGDAGNYAASYAIARGDILYKQGNLLLARDAYNEALLLAAAGGSPINAPSLQQKLQSLAEVSSPESSAVEADLFDAGAAPAENSVLSNDAGSETEAVNEASEVEGLKESTVETLEEALEEVTDKVEVEAPTS